MSLRGADAVYASKVDVEFYSRLTDLFEIEKILLDTVFPGKGCLILDLGCGTGRTTAHLIDRGYKVIACDISRAMIEQAKTTFPAIDFRVMDAANLDFSENSFDCVWFSFNGIDHMFPETQRIRALGEVRRVLKPAGIFVYSSTNIIARLFIRKNPLSFVRHQIPYMLSHLKRNGFSMYWETGEHGKQFDFYMSPPSSQLRVLKAAGFVDARVHSLYGKDLWRVTLNDRWPHYSARKPVDV